MAQYTANENLYKWSTSDTKQTTITETASNAEKIDAKLNDHTVQLAEIVNITGFNTDNYPRIVPEVDDTGKIQRAVTAAENAKSVLVIPYGKTFTISSKISITKEVTVIAYGVSVNTTSNIHMFEIQLGADHVRIKGLTFEGNSLGAEQRGLQTFADYGLFEDVRFKNTGSNGYVDIGEHNEIKNAWGYNCYSDNTVPGDYGTFHFLNSMYSKLTSCISLQAKRSGLSLSNAKRCTVRGLSVLSPVTPYTQMGVYELDGSEDNTFEDIEVFNVSAECFDLRGVGGCVIRGLRMYGESAFGLSISESAGKPTPKNIEVTGLVCKLNSGIALHLYSVNGVIEDVTIRGSFNARSIVLKQRTKGIKFEKCIFDQTPIAYQDGADNEMFFDGCTWKNHNNATGDLMLVTNATLQSCIFENITIRALFSNAYSTVQNVRVYNCKTVGTNTITRIIHGTDGMGVFTLDGNYFTDIAEIYNYVSNPPMIFTHNGKMNQMQGYGSTIPTLDAAWNKGKVILNNNPTVSAGKILLAWISDGTVWQPVYVTNS